jgi:hypothetical protein
MVQYTPKKPSKKVVITNYARGTIGNSTGIIFKSLGYSKILQYIFEMITSTYIGSIFLDLLYAVFAPS